MLYTPFFTKPSSYYNTSPQNSNQQTNEKNPIKEEIVDILKENGLSNDVDYFLSEANRFLLNSSNLGLENNNYYISALTSLQSIGNKVKRNKELYDVASKQMIEENSGSEIALTNTGQLYVLDNNGLKIISPDEYYKNSDKYRLVTNTELMQLRENNSNLAFNSTILSDLSNTIGMKSIVDYIKSTITSFGTLKTNGQFDRYTTKQKDKIEEGFEQLLGFNYPNGVYKITEDTSSSNQGYQIGNKESLQYAVNYLYQTLPNNMKNVLQANAAAQSLNPNDPNDVKSLLQASIIEHTNHDMKTDTNVAYDDKLSSTIEGSPSYNNDTVKDSYLTSLIHGTWGKTFEVTLNPYTKYGINVTAQSESYPLNDNMQQIGRATLRDVLDDSIFGKTIDKNSISFGNQVLKNYELDRVVYDGTSDLIRTELPINERIYEQTGQIVPDLEAVERFEKFDQWLKEGYGITPTSVAMKLQELDLNLYYDNNSNEWKFKNTNLFFVLSGYASDKGLDINNNNWLYNVDREEGKEIFKDYTQFVNYGSETSSKSKKRDDFRRSSFLGIGLGNANSMYRGNIFMPVSDTQAAGLVSQDVYRPKQQYTYPIKTNDPDTLKEAANIKTQF